MTRSRLCAGGIAIAVFAMIGCGLACYRLVSWSDGLTVRALGAHDALNEGQGRETAVVAEYRLGAAVDLLDRWEAAIGDFQVRPEREALHSFVQGLSLHEASRLLEPTRMIGDADVRTEVRRELLRRLADLNGELAAAIFESWPDEERLSLLAAVVVEGWAKTDPSPAVKWLDQVAEEQVVAALAAVLKDHGLADVRRWVSTLRHDETRLWLCEAIVREWNPTRAADAASLTVETLSGQAAADVLGGIVSDWAGRDGREAARWVSTIPEGTLRTTALVHLTTAWSETDARAAAVLVDSLRSVELPVAAALARQWAAHEPEEAASWVMSFSDETMRGRLVSSLASVWARSDPAAALGFVQQLPYGSPREQALLSAALGWALHDVAAAARWIGLLPEGPTRRYAMEGVSAHWIQVDPGSAITWQRSLPANPDRDAALQASVEGLIAEHPDLAASVASVIEDHEMRHIQAERAVTAWLAVDPQAAREWIVQSALSPGTKRQLLQSTM